MTLLHRSRLSKPVKSKKGNKKANLEEGWLWNALDFDLALSGVLEQHIDAL
jgi:hypothetical protein